MSRAVNDFKLSDEQNLAIFEGIIAPHFLGDLSPCEEPVAYFTGGQPGAGKSSLQKFIKKNYSPSAVVIEGDAFRSFHPDFDELSKTKNFARLTAQDSAKWVERSIDYVQNNKTSVILEGTLRRPYITINTAQSFAERGFQNQLHIMAVHGYISRYRILKRYLHAKQIHGNGRYTFLNDHNASYNNIAKSVRSILHSNYFQYLSIYDAYANPRIDMLEVNLVEIDEYIDIFNQTRKLNVDHSILIDKLYALRKTAQELHDRYATDDIRRFIHEIESTST